MKYKRTHILFIYLIFLFYFIFCLFFFPADLNCHSKIMPLFRILPCKPMTPCEQNIWRTA